MQLAAQGPSWSGSSSGGPCGTTSSWKGSWGGNLLSPQAVAKLQPETMAEEDLVALGQELSRQQMNARSGAQAVQEASLEELIDRQAYTEVWPALQLGSCSAASWSCWCELYQCA